MHTPHSNEFHQLLSEIGIVQSACDLDLLLFLHRHPRILLTSEQLTEFVGYPLKDIAKALERFLEAGCLQRTAQSGHAARMFLLLLQGPQGGAVRTLLDMASTRRGRQRMLETIENRYTSPEQRVGIPALKIVNYG